MTMPIPVLNHYLHLYIRAINVHEVVPSTSQSLRALLTLHGENCATFFVAAFSGVAWQGLPGNAWQQCKSHLGTAGPQAPLNNAWQSPQGCDLLNTQLLNPKYFVVQSVT
mmetsp:Transcript_12/g.23  ORF Transcript_12/g.23 Transcript_12/m.23 type:complete len:110 (-) Transcript_12:1515-1844(-)